MVNNFNSTRTNEKQKLKINLSYRRSSSLKDTLMFRKSQLLFGVFACHSGCILCEHYLHKDTHLTLKTGITLRPNARFDCMSRNVIYIIVCAGCLEFYIGETGDCLCNRFSTHRAQSKEDSPIQPVKADPHLRTCGKGRYKVFPFMKPKHKSTVYRRELEDRWIKKLKPKLNALE